MARILSEAQKASLGKGDAKPETVYNEKDRGNLDGPQFDTFESEHKKQQSKPTTEGKKIWRNIESFNDMQEIARLTCSNPVSDLLDYDLT